MFDEQLIIYHTMIIRNSFIVTIFAIGLFSCTEVTEVSEKETPTVSTNSSENEADESTEKESEAESSILETISFFDRI